MGPLDGRSEVGQMLLGDTPYQGSGVGNLTLQRRDEDRLRQLSHPCVNPDVLQVLARTEGHHPVDLVIAYPEYELPRRMTGSVSFV
jgi:hypothetical protein